MNGDAAETHRQHIPGLIFECDIRKLSKTDYLRGAELKCGELDLLFAGPPCQGFSVIGTRKVSDTRNSLFREVLRATRAMRPKSVVIENVPGLISLADGYYLRSVLLGLKRLGYQAACAELLAAHYGAPQMRWRLVIVGWREDLDIPAGFGFPVPTHGKSAIGDLISNVPISDEACKGFISTKAAIGDLPPVLAGQTGYEYLGPPRSAFQRQARKTESGTRMDFRELHDHYAAALGEATLTRLRLLKPGQDWRDLPYELLPPSMKRAQRKDHTRRYRRMTWDGIPRAIITRFRDPKSGEYTHPDQDRTITIREAARIQGFPDWYSFSGSNTSKYSQVGNAIPVPLASAIALEVSRCLEDVGGRERLDLPFRRRPVDSLGRHGELINLVAA
jgi:DNA (cytosine-5)-methyltransferase 1